MPFAQRQDIKRISPVAVQPEPDVIEPAPEDIISPLTPVETTALAISPILGGLGVAGRRVLRGKKLALPETLAGKAIALRGLGALPFLARRAPQVPLFVDPVLGGLQRGVPRLAGLARRLISRAPRAVTPGPVAQPVVYPSAGEFVPRAPGVVRTAQKLAGRPSVIQRLSRAQRLLGGVGPTTLAPAGIPVPPTPVQRRLDALTRAFARNLGLLEGGATGEF